MLKVFESLKDKWILSRQVIPGGQIKGHAEFKEKGKRKLEYYEATTFTLDNGHILEAEKRYDYLLNSEGKIEVYFADGVNKGEIFQVLVCDEKAIAEAEHFCNPDNYISQYDFKGLPEIIRINHTVIGPKKEYKSKTILTRVRKP